MLTLQSNALSSLHLPLVQFCSAFCAHGLCNENGLEFMDVSTSLGNVQVGQILSSPGDLMSLPPSLGFARLPFSKNGRVHVESCCSQCNFRILKWHEDFDDQEQRHTAECRGRRPE